MPGLSFPWSESISFMGNVAQVELDSCAESDMSSSVGKTSSCLSYTPKVVRIEIGSSANIYVDNVAYQKFLRKTFDVTAIDEDSAVIAIRGNFNSKWAS